MQSREQLFEWMRERQKLKQEIAAGERPPAERPLSLTGQRRRQRQKGPGGELPAHLQFFHVSDLAEILGVSRQTVERWFEGRAIVAGTRRRRTLLISRQVFDDWLREHDASRLSA